MGRSLVVPQDPDIDANSQGLLHITPVACVVHDTIGVYSGPDSGDSQYIENHGLAHYVIGEDEGEWEQLVDDECFTAHCNGANFKAIGYEFSRAYAGQPLTSWQIKAWGMLQQDSYERFWIPPVYLDPDVTPYASIWVNGGGYQGWISHANVRTDDGSQQHFDYLQYSDWTKAVQGTHEQDEDMLFSQWPIGEVLAFGKFIQDQVHNADKSKPIDLALIEGAFQQDQIKHVLNEGKGEGTTSWAETNKALYAHTKK